MMNVAMNIGVDTSVLVSALILGGIYSEMELLHHMVIMFLFF